MICANAWMRLAIEPGKRCIAGLSEHKAGELVRVVIGDLGDVESTYPVGDLLWAGEGGFHRNLLVENHPDQQRERVLRQKLIGLGVLRQAELHGQRRVPSRQATQLPSPNHK